MLTPMKKLSELQDAFSEHGKYLFFSIGHEGWFVNSKLSVPRFFRDRFAIAAIHPERGNWKTMRENIALMEEAQEEIHECKRKFLESAF